MEPVETRNTPLAAIGVAAQRASIVFRAPVRVMGAFPDLLPLYNGGLAHACKLKR
jgi:hypothetical protein